MDDPHGHLEQCASCRDAVERERAFSGALRATLQRSTAQLTLGPGLHDRVLRAAAAPPVSVAWSSAWQRLLALSLQPVGAACGVFLLAALGFAFRQWSDRPQPKVGVPPPGTITWIVRVPVPTEQPAFEIVDTPSRQMLRVREKPMGGTAIAFAAITEARP